MQPVVGDAVQVRQLLTMHELFVFATLGDIQVVHIPAQSGICELEQGEFGVMQSVVNGPVQVAHDVWQGFYS